MWCNQSADGDTVILDALRIRTRTHISVTEISRRLAHD